jgi:6-phospho-beta-glucosidase
VKGVQGVKLSILGGGGFRVPLVYKALLGDTGSPRVETVTLYDPSAERLAIIRTVLAQQAGEFRNPPKVETTTDLDVAVRGSDFVFSAIRVAGLPGRIQDERVALRLGVLGQETTGPGGIAYGLRTIPVALHIAERVKALAPQAYVINFTNPAGMITESMQRVLGERVVGICDTPSGLGNRIAATLGLDAARVQLDYVGLNHLGWMRRVIHNGRDVLPELLADDGKLSSLEEGEIFGLPWLRTLGCIPNEYLYYYYFNRDAVHSILEKKETRGEFLVSQQGDFYRAVAADPEHAFDIWHRTVTERNALYMAEAKGEQTTPQDVPESGGYEAVALAVMAAIARNEKATIILNTRGGGALPGLDPDAVVELPSIVDANGIHPLATTPPELAQLGLIQQIKAVERLTIEAATTGSATAAEQAFALHPLVDSVSVARELLDGYAAAIPEVAAVLR